MRGFLHACVAALLLLLPAAALAQLEGVAMPGKLIEGHAKLEENCRNCHVPFDKAAQDRLCLNCHKEVAADVAGHQGMHGRIRIETCRKCHTDHKGRDVNTANFDPARFDHALTDYALKDGHAKVECKSCHVAGKKWREAPLTCVGCHRKDDTHKGSLGADCAQCHVEKDWKTTRFDHSKTKFALTGKHLKTKCDACHTKPDHKDTPKECVACHRKEDTHKGRYGAKCESCHGAASWKPSTFDHDTATKYPLRLKHRSTKCDTCHAGNLYRDKVETTCNGCHRKDDAHKGSLGPQCQNCHDEGNWKKAKFDHGKTRFALTGKHAPLECKSCHEDVNKMKDTPRECVSCHRKDDQASHKRKFGDKCETCHLDTGWKNLKFTHDRDTSFVLKGAHAKLTCQKCHTGTLYRQKLGEQCIDCHRKDDPHKKQLGEDCGSCHGEVKWKRDVRFNHDRTRFPLVGRHRDTDCTRCHDTPAYKDAKRECVACHKADDKHKGGLGPKCESCHNARSWAAWDYDHARTRFPLDGAHKTLDCIACHKPGSKDPKLSTDCGSCHVRDDVHEGRFGRACDRCHVTSRWNLVKPGTLGGTR